MNKNKKLYNEENKKSLNWSKVASKISELTANVLILGLIVLMLYIFKCDYDHRNDMQTIFKDNNYTTIEEINEELVIQYHNETKKVSIAYVDRRFRECCYIRKELSYTYNTETKDFEHLMEGE